MGCCGNNRVTGEAPEPYQFFFKRVPPRLHANRPLPRSLLCCRPPLPHAHGVASPHPQRGCTDILCLLIFLLFWGGVAFLGYLSITVGDPYEILYGADYLGNRCGRGDFSDKKKVTSSRLSALARPPAAHRATTQPSSHTFPRSQIYFPRIDKDIAEQAAIASSMPWKLNFYGLCVDSCPDVPSPTSCFDDPSSCIVNDYGTAAEYAAAGGSAVRCPACHPSMYHHQPTCAR